MVQFPLTLGPTGCWGPGSGAGAGAGAGAGSFDWPQAVIENPIAAIMAIIPKNLDLFFMAKNLLVVFCQGSNMPWLAWQNVPVLLDAFLYNGAKLPNCQPKRGQICIFFG